MLEQDGAVPCSFCLKVVRMLNVMQEQNKGDLECGLCEFFSH